MTILTTLGPLLLALILGYAIPLEALSPKQVQKGLSWLTYLILGLIGLTIGQLENLEIKLLTAGYQAFVFFMLMSFIGLSALCISGHYLSRDKAKQTPATREKIHLGVGVFADAFKTLACVVAGLGTGLILDKHLGEPDTLITWLLYVLLFLIGRQLKQENFRLRKLFLNSQGLIIATVTVVSTLGGGLLGAIALALPYTDGLAVVSGFGWYSLSGILITGLGDPVLGTTAFLLDIGREILALVLIPILSRVNSHMSVGFSGATAMDFTLPMISKFHGPNIIPTAIASGFIMSLLVPTLIPIFMGL